LAIKLQPPAADLDEEALAALDELDDAPDADAEADEAFFDDDYYYADEDDAYFSDDESAEALMELLSGEVDEEVLQALFGTGEDDASGAAQLAAFLESLGLEIGEANDAARFGDAGGVRLVDGAHEDDALPEDDEEEFANSEL